MEQCPTCDQTLSSRGQFCPSCGAQARCKNCGALLEPNAAACVECGTLIGDGEIARADGRHRSAHAPNVLRLEETRENRTLEVNFTDAAVENLSVPLAAYLSGGLYRAPAHGSHDRREPVGPTVLPLVSPTDGEIFDIPDSSYAVSTPVHVEPADDRHRLHSMFTYEGERLRLKDSRIKADTKIEYVGRLTVLFLYAHELEGRAKVPRGTLNAFLAEATLYDAAARRWRSATTDVLSDSDMVELSVPGRERAVETLKRNLDPSVTGSFVLGANSRTRGGKQVAGKKDDGVTGSVAKSAKPRRAVESTKIAPWVEKWKAAGVNVDAFELLKSKTAGDKGLFGLWAIRKALGDEGKIVTRVQLAQFLYQAFEIKHTDAAYYSALRNSSMKEKVHHLGGTRFQITPEGIAYIERLIGTTQPPTAASTSVNGSTAAVP